jgi:hypothetical protein
LLNTNKLLDVKYTNKGKTTSRKEFAKDNELPKKDRINMVGKMRLMEEKDAKEVLRLYNLQMKNVGVHLVLSKSDILYMLMSKPGIINTYVVEDPDKQGKLCDFLSLTVFTQIVLNGKEQNHEYTNTKDAAFYFWSFTRNTEDDWIKTAMYIARDEMGCDSLCINGQMNFDADKLCEEHKFKHDANPFHYYLVNYSMGPERMITGSEDMGIVLP